MPLPRRTQTVDQKKEQAEFLAHREALHDALERIGHARLLGQPDPTPTTDIEREAAAQCETCRHWQVKP